MMFCEIVKNVLVLCQMQWDVKPSKKFTFCLVSPQNIFLKNLGDRQDVFLINVKQSFFGGGLVKLSCEAMDTSFSISH